MDSNIPPNLQQVFTQAMDAGLKVEPYRLNPGMEMDQKDNPVTGLVIHLPNGIGTRTFQIKNDERLQDHCKVSFEQLQFIAGSEATWSRLEDAIEAELQGDEITYNAAFLLKRLKYVFRPTGEGCQGDDTTLIIPYRRNLVRLDFGESSHRFNLLNNYTGLRPKLVIRITGTGAVSHDEARNALHHITEPLLFQIKREYNIHLRIRSEHVLFSENRIGSFLNGMLTLGS